MLIAQVAQSHRHLGTLLAFHHVCAYVVIIGNGLAGCWALGAHRVLSLRTKSLWWFTCLVELAVFAQVGTGIAMVTSLHAHPLAFHPFYGFVAVIVIGVLYAYREQLRRRVYLLYGFGGLFLMGVAIRALLTAHAK